MGLPPGERWLAVRAIGWLLAMRVALRLVPFTGIRRFVSSRPPPLFAADAGWPQAVRRAGLRAARVFPDSSCLARSLVGELLLRSGGHPATLRIGVATPPAGGGTKPLLDAHAWVESGGVLIAGDADLGRYTELAQFGGEG
jgi:hypothetical protein